MGFRIALQMTKIFSDERSLCYVYINEKFKKIHHLESHVIDLFEVEGPFCLMNQNHLLPSCENIQILRGDEVITVVPIHSPFSFNNTTFSSIAPTKSPEEVESVEKEVKKKKRKKNKESLQDAAVTESVDDNVSLQSPVDNSLHSKVFTNPEVFTAIKNIEEYHSKLVKKTEEEEVEAMKSKALNALKDFFPTNINGVSDGRIKKRKRIRIRKSKKSNQVEYLQSDSESNITQNNKSLVLTNGKKNGSHIRFTPAVDKPIVILQNEIDLQKFDKKPRIVRAIQPEMLTSLNGSPNAVTDTAKNLNGNSFENKTNGDEKEKYFLNHVDCSGSVRNTDKNTQYQDVDRPLTNILKQLDTYPVESKMSLKNDDVIVFKMLKIGEDYTPIFSNHILGKVLSYSTDEQTIKLTILDGHQECMEPSGKFQLEDGLEDDFVPKSIDVSWDQLLEPRIIHS